MYFKFSLRRHPNTGIHSAYYRLVESYRNSENRVCHHTILNIGYLEDARPEQLNEIQKRLTDKYEQKQSLFEPEEDVLVMHYVHEFWQRIKASGKVDLKQSEKLKTMVTVESLVHSDVREIGSEHICYQTWQKLQLSQLLLSKGWTEQQVQLAATQVISRSVYPASELATSRWIKENSALCELTGYDIEKLTKDKLYQSALNLYKVKDALETHLSKRTNDLFDLEDKIILYDLTNTYFEGRKVNSKLANFGRSKEKRSDAKLVVLALVINVEGFIKYSSVLEGNIADCKTLSLMIDKLAAHSTIKKAVVVLDAGIATEENLKLIEQKGYQYVCVSRSKLKDYQALPNKLPVVIQTKSKHEVSLKAVSTAKNTDYYLEVTSDAKVLKEKSMTLAFEKRYEEELQKIKISIDKKNGIKKADKVHERIGRAKEKYPSLQACYQIDVELDTTLKLVTKLTWKKDTSKYNSKTIELGVYFLRTNMNINDEVNVWNIYNTIREIENTFRTLKTELDLRPIYHKNDAATMAHLHLGLLAYWLVNTVRYQLKNNGINSCWSEIVRIGNTQKVITTSGTNTQDKIITIRKCSEPNKNLANIYTILKIKQRPFAKRKFVVHKSELEKNGSQQIKDD